MGVLILMAYINKMSGLLDVNLIDIPSVPELPQLPEVSEWDIVSLVPEETLRRVLYTLLVIKYFKLFFPVVVAFTVEAQNTTFRQLASNTKYNKWPVPVFGYLLTVAVLTTLVSLLGYLLNQYVLKLSVSLSWVVVVLFLAAAVFSFLTVEKLWKGHNAEHGDHLLGEKGHGKSFLNVVLDILKVQNVEITQKTVLLLASASSTLYAYVFVESLASYLVLAVLAVTVGAKLAESSAQRVFQILAGVSLLLWGLLIAVQTVLFSVFDVSDYLEKLHLA
jgi:putative Ca2+/H+ antiporter (TMEM165/GDT1 family)